MLRLTNQRAAKPRLRRTHEASTHARSMQSSPNKTLARAAGQMSTLAAGLLATLCGLVLVTGVSQQTFERFAPPTEYARALLAAAAPLRLIVAIDDVFIVSYIAATLLLCAAQAERASKLLLSVVLGAALLGGTLDLIENHHILAMLTQAEFGGEPSSVEIGAQVVASSLKWMLGHAAFALLAFVLEAPERLRGVLRGTLLGVQLPLGALTLVVVHPGWLELLTWLRYGCLLGGFLSISWLTAGASRRSSVDLRSHARERASTVAVGSDAPP
jgi:hypothetical protein